MSDQHYMQRALQLAQLGIGKVSPNPMVGCVIVHHDKIIGEGYHEQYGGPHAEVNAVADVTNKELLNEAVVYVTLEPCSHYGKTPPCADLLVHHQVKKVVICNDDPNPLVAGKGIQRLKEAGIVVEIGLLSDQGLELNRRFFTSFEKKRPYVILKWAQTADGFVARENFDSKWISNQYSRQMVHKWRSEEIAILVGKNTALYDNPSLTTRDWYGADPVRVVLDKKLELNRSMHLFDGSVKTYCFTTLEEVDSANMEFIQVAEITPGVVLQELHNRRIQSIIIEGGSKTLQSFIDANLWDEARVFTSETRFEKGIKAPDINGNIISEENVQQDQLRIIRNHG
ncbi:bifunctional diaminohydroxyphosphoribosylaminopyrimidine deaminase/5-amino-6-(5-phosphoribosylamino)uracil reductase RibD [Marinoscillum pacificum]|uniref:bifunctional diaminohydroxyphosphoribosylaminopyrimidine deaminase/5-amino-6-(5-phosphoribosylamino)uracil reductase RibD n=1 Tax=Marinoscillum pacificum TaxID=392723 RepID=UPI002157FB7A|nr:bifunctional diaminohydroxyphosphoribosylaminopyrimidine deaminase/5-amino-6-(5-phosphoribosylamino)uracil reductase RibD [Marinoscillum pacificum]